MDRIGDGNKLAPNLLIAQESTKDEDNHKFNQRGVDHCRIKVLITAIADTCRQFYAQMLNLRKLQIFSQ